MARTRDTSNRQTVQLSDIARQTGYSLATVSKVLNGRTDVAEETRRIISQALKHSGYVRRTSGDKDPKLIEIVFETLDNVWSLELLRGVMREAEANHISVVTVQNGDHRHPNSRWVSTMMRHKPLGVILVFSDLSVEEQDMLANCKIPYVILDPAGDPAPCSMSVQADNWTGGLLGTRHLLSLGHTRIGIITGPNDMLCARARLDGYAAALKERELAVDPSLTREGAFTTESGYRQAITLLSNPDTRPTAIFAGNDLQAMGIYEAARQLNLRIPEDLSVVGFDDVQTAAFMGPALTTVRQPLADMAAAATRMVLEAPYDDSSAQRLILPTKLIIRNSTATPPNA